MERQVGLGRSLEDVLDSVPPVEPLEPARTDVLFGIAAEETPIAPGTSHGASDPKKKKKKKKSKSKSKQSAGDKKQHTKSGDKKKKKKKK
jgi:hypothetical protein